MDWKHGDQSKDEARWIQIQAVCYYIKTLEDQGKTVTYDNMQNLPKRFRAMVRHYYLCNGHLKDMWTLEELHE